MKSVIILSMFGAILISCGPTTYEMTSSARRDNIALGDGSDLPSDDDLVSELPPSDDNNPDDTNNNETPPADDIAFEPPPSDDSDDSSGSPELPETPTVPELPDVADLEDDEVDDVVPQWARCGSDRNPKVLICHVPRGNPEAAHTICIAQPALRAHIDGHGGESLDYLGSCRE